MNRLKIMNKNWGEVEEKFDSLNALSKIGRDMDIQEKGQAAESV